MFEKKSVCTALGFVSTEHEDESKSIGARISNMEFVPFHLNPADTNVKAFYNPIRPEQLQFV